MIYFVRDSLSGAIKIGYAIDAWARLQYLQVGSAGELTLLAVDEGSKADERALHERFADCRVRGEWFRASVELMAHIATLPGIEAKPRKRCTRSFWNGMSAQELAAATGICGSMLSHIKQGIRRPSPEVALKIQDACGVSAIKLVFGELADRAA